MHAAPQKVVNRPAAPVVQRAQLPAAAVPRPQVRTMPGTLQPAGGLRVSSPSDPAEREAEQTARRIMRMPAPGVPTAISPQSAGSVLRSPYVARFAGSIVQRETVIARQAAGSANVSENVAAEIRASQGGGSALPKSVRRFMEPRFGANFSKVRVHTDARAAKLNRQVSARAFTVGNQVFFGGGQFQQESQGGRELIAHELTHTIQQGAAVQRSEELQRAEDVTVSERSPTQVQRLGLSDALNFFARQANNIPGFRMFTIVLGVNPINMSSVDRSPANIMRAIVEFLPGGGLITQALDNHGVFDKVGNWVAQQIATLGMVGGTIKQAISAFLDSLSWSDIFDLGGVWERAKRIFTEPIDRIISFVRNLVTGIITFIKDAILMPIARLAQGTPSYELLCAVMGKDPITGQAVPQNADTLIGGFMKLIGQSDVWENMKKANAVARAFAWFKGALASLLGFVRQIPTLFLNAFKALEIMDIVLLPRAFAKLVGVFGNFVVSFVQWAGNAVWNLLEIVVDSVSPGAFGYIKRTGAALKSILKNPLPFIGNLVRAAKLGFQNFASNFGEHLKAGLIEWLTGSLPGVYIPKAFSLVEVGKFALSVLGISWAQIRAKIVRVLGPAGETIMRGLETGFEIVVALVTGGPAAAWEIIKDKLTDLKDTVINGIKDFVIDIVVKKAIPKLIAMFIPGAGFISAILSIYDTVMVFVEKIARIIQVVRAFIDSIVAIAGGAIAAAAGRVERILAGLLSLAISFLAGFIGLGRVSDKIMGVIGKVRATVDRAIDSAIAWIVAQARRLGRLVVAGARSAAGRLVEWWRARKTFVATDRSSHALFFQGQGASAVLTVASTPTPVRAFLSDVRAAATSSTADPAVRTAFASATAKSAQVDTLRATVEGGPNPRQPQDIDALNAALEELANLLPPLIPLKYPPPAAAPGGAHVAVGELIKLTRNNLVAVVTALDAAAVPGILLVKFRVVSPRTDRRTTSLPTGYPNTSFGTEFQRHTDDPRELYLGGTPSKTSGVGRDVKARMRQEGKYDPATDQILYARNGQRYHVRDCDMGHIIDAVNWWNSNGRLTGARSSAVQAFMNNPINYEFEPSSENRRRGAALAGRYQPPVV